MYALLPSTRLAPCLAIMFFFCIPEMTREVCIAFRLCCWHELLLLFTPDMKAHEGTQKHKKNRYEETKTQTTITRTAATTTPSPPPPTTQRLLLILLLILVLLQLLLQLRSLSVEALLYIRHGYPPPDPPAWLPNPKPEH